MPPEIAVTAIAAVMMSGSSSHTVRDEVKKMKTESLMKLFTFFLFACLSFNNAVAHPQDNMSPEGLMHYYVKLVNEENAAALQDVYHFPHVKITGGKLAQIDDPAIPVIDFDGLKKSGWKYSKINKVKILAEGSNAALVELNFSRFDANDKEFLNQTTFYNLTRNNGFWQIMSIQSMGQLAGVKGK